MFYNALKNECPLQIDPFKALVGPRPIGWISSLAPDGTVNLAPYSFFNGVCDSPPMVVFSSAGRKDSIENIEKTGEFVCNLATWELRDAMNVSSAAVGSEVDEFELAGLEKIPSTMVKPPRVAGSPVALECRYTQTVPMVGVDGETLKYALVIGQVVGVYIDDSLIVNERIDIAKAKPIARHGYMDYSVVTELFRIERP
ncbi:Nitrilotriacetate monooxygenase component B [hydrothermal vent metagenome]|uniref:Nitrilotriacetate monooxygenase component B n=1 Tax=hydrothermal vent metagenome TaxID=652676 RepID=A0A3B0SLU7_9ZZZZ